MLKETYLVKVQEVPKKDAEVVFVMRKRGNDELAPSAELLSLFNHYKEKCPYQLHQRHIYAWEHSDYYKTFKTQILSDSKAMGKLKHLSEQSEHKDIYLCCYEAPDKPCHRHILLEIAQKHFGAETCSTRAYVNRTLRSRRKKKCKHCGMPSDEWYAFADVKQYRRGYIQYTNICAQCADKLFNDCLYPADKIVYVSLAILEQAKRDYHEIEPGSIKYKELMAFFNDCKYVDAWCYMASSDNRVFTYKEYLEAIKEG